MSIPKFWSWRCEVHGLTGFSQTKPQVKPTDCGFLTSTACIVGDGTWEPLPRSDEPCQFADEPKVAEFVKVNEIAGASVLRWVPA